MKNNITLFICLLISVACFAQSPKREQRATWVATVFRIDWPSTVISSPGNSSDIKLQKKRLVEILDSLSSGNMNAIYFQIRSQCDAIYNSAYEPWSSDFVATRGMDPGYDPFEFLIEEGHKRGIEVHAWLNPYRFESAAGKWEGQIGDYRKSNPDWVLEVKNQTILNPGIPEVRQRITDIVEDILLKYDLDGIMFDDYFYLSGISDEDKKEQIKYNTTGLSVEDWRRQNVNKMIAQVYHKIQDLKPFVKFGVGPAGIWGGPKSAADAYGVTNPAGIGSGFAYNKIFCDPLAWLHEKTIDYISPQIYWTIGSAGTDYDILSKWWSEVSNKFNRNFYSSHSLSAMDPKPAPGRRFTVNGISVEDQGLSGIEKIAIQELTENKASAEKAPFATNGFGFGELCNQISCNRNYDLNGAPGSVFYSNKSYMYNGKSVDYIKRNRFTHPALTPAIYWKNHIEYEPVKEIILAGNTLSWKEMDPGVRYAVYAIPMDKINSPGVTGSSLYLHRIVYANQCILPESVINGKYTFAVAVVDRFGNEFPAGILNTEVEKMGDPVIDYPQNNQKIVCPALLKWKTVPGTDYYIVQLSESADFATIFCQRETTVNSISTVNFFPLEEDKTYYLRVKSRGIGNRDGISAVTSFASTLFKVYEPLNNAIETSLTPLFRWMDMGAGIKYRIEISTNGVLQPGTNNFDPATLVFQQETMENSLTIPADILFSGTSYYARIITNVGEEESGSAIIRFTTKIDVPEIPVILSPVHLSTITSSNVEITWEPDKAASGFRIEMNKSISFPARTSKIKETAQGVYMHTFENIDNGLWYLRMRANYGNTNTDWTEPRSFTVNNIPDGLEYAGHKQLVYIEYNKAGSDILYLKEKTDEHILLQIVSVTGKVVFAESGTISAGGNSYRLDLSFLSRGIYLIKIQINDQVQVLKYIR